MSLRVVQNDWLTDGATLRAVTIKAERKWQPVGESNPSFQVENLAS